MFGKKSALDPKKATLKFLDPKKDTTTRLKYLRNVLDIVDTQEAKILFEANYSNVYFVFYDQFITVENSLKQRAHKTNREELDAVLLIFEKIILLLPELLSRKWQCHSIGRLMKKLLHPGNSLKLRIEGVRLFLMWYQILGEDAPQEVHRMFGCLVPGFQLRGELGSDTLEGLVTGVSLNSKGINFNSAVCPLEITPILPPPSGDKIADENSQVFMECLMEYMVSQVTKIEWKDKTIAHQQKCFQFLFDKFKKYYLINIFPDFNWKTSLYKPCLDLPELKPYKNDNNLANNVYDHLNNAPGKNLLRCRVVVARWVATFTHSSGKGEAHCKTSVHSSSNSEENDAAKENKNVVTSSESNLEKYQSSVILAGPGTDKDSNHAYVANEDHSNIEHTIVRDTLYHTRENVNFVHEVFRQALLLPWTEGSTMRRVIAVYRDWIFGNDSEIPSFMLEAHDNPFGNIREDKISFKPAPIYPMMDGPFSSEETSQSRASRLRNDSYLGAIHRENLNVRAGMQNTLQVFISHAANVFLQEVGPESGNSLDEQVDMCKRVLNIYRYIVMNSCMEQKTWEQLLLVLLHVTSQILGDGLPARKDETLGGRLAPALFQTLIVTWIKANLNVYISTDLWDQFLQVLSSLTHWEELIKEWAKTMETLTRVLAKLVYNLDLTDLPLDRLSEQKQKKRRGRQQPVDTQAPHYKVWGKQGLEGASQMTPRTESGTPDPSGVNASVKPGTPGDSKGNKGDWFVERSRYRSSSGGDASAKLPHRPSSRAERGGALPRSASEGNLAPKRRGASQKFAREKSAGLLSTTQEHDSTKEGGAFDDIALKDVSADVRIGVLRKSRSADSLKFARASTPSSLSDSSVDGPSRSPSPSPSNGLESNSIKDSPMQIDGVGGENSCSAEMWESGKGELRSIMAGGNAPGWTPDAGVALWKRMLGVLGDVNAIQDADMHYQVFQYLVELFETLVKIRDNQGVTVDNQSTPPPPELTPPLNILAPWLFKAVTLPVKYKKGKLCAYRLLCSMTVRRHDVTISRDHIAQFYTILHADLLGNDQEVINTIVRYCGPKFFSLKLPGSNLLMLDFIYAADTIASSLDLKEAPRTEAVSLLGAMLCFPNAYPDLPVLMPKALELSCNDQKRAKEHIINVLLKSGRREPAGLARCVALSALGIYLYEEFAHCSNHEKIRDAINVLLTALKITNKMVGLVACDMLRLLTDHTVALMKSLPDVPRKIIKVLAATLSSLLPSGSSETVEVEKELQQLIISLMFCLGEWCMHMPQALLSQQDENGDSLLLVVLKVLDAAVSGNGGVFQTPLSHMDLNCPDFDFNVQLNNLQEKPSYSPRHLSSSSPEQGSVNFSIVGDTQGSFNMIELAARTVMSHLVNHLGHFPMGIGASRLTSMVNECDDIPGLSIDDLSSDVFHAPNVQFFVLNHKTLISFVELPTLDVPGGGVTAGLTTAKCQVRVIVRDMSGKFSWDSSILYGSPNSLNDVTLNDTWVGDMSQTIRNTYQTQDDFMSVIGEPNTSPRIFSMRHRPSHVLPVFEDSAEDMDNLDDLLQYIGYSSPECLYHSGQPLNIPRERPTKLCPIVQEDVMTTVLNQRSSELDFVRQHKTDTSIMGRPMRPNIPCEPEAPFQHCRLLINQMGLMSWEKRVNFDLLKKNEKLLRELRNLDNQKCRETHKIAVIFVAEGQEDKNSVLMNTGGGQPYEEFVAGLAWETELLTHTGFMGGLQANGSTGDTAPYYATSFMEVIFHVATRMPSNSDESKFQKLRHLGNDEVHIVWSEHSRDYRRGIITTEFADVLIVIYPLPNKMYRIQISRKQTVPYFGPLFDGAIVDHKALPGLVRATAINASRATRSTMPIYQPFYKERVKALETIIKNHKDMSTFEDFTSSVVMPVQPKQFQGGSPWTTGSGLKGDSAGVLALSNLAAALLDSHSRGGALYRSRPSSLSSCSEQSSPAIIHDAHFRGSNLPDLERGDDFKEVSKVPTSEALKRLSFKGNARKSQSGKTTIASTPPESPPQKGKK